ncbi:Factor arrest protein 11 [Wickerhamomyces ciferrii]|uniref:Factor arrest protein 11 n=1 Tax=Wickerhamomyces ciferrii (strain ATCC 14091 / BCRC 22168 / CBS 111 / JCM 3599 / NBRC 0793 / NRRL Y-1031 F-60-10) TaxID=1206466 RepID=K0KIH5_WICCF|nr:Factor arrest protein 11 [Wickerhamomyces ciferrii]CCH40963.1 Factor arrest protein 11 [Wickerhamomyces ciferrii]
MPSPESSESSPLRSGILHLNLGSPELRLPKSPESDIEHIRERFEGLERPGIEILQNQEDEESNDDIDMLNIDEVDQVRGEISDSNLAVDEEFQHSLNERANQFTPGSEGNSINTTSFPSIPKPKVDFVYGDNFSLSTEVNEWFTERELKQLPLFKRAFKSFTGSADFNSLDDIQKSALITILNEKLQHRDTTLNSLLCIVFISLGSYHAHSSIESHQAAIISNNRLLASKNLIPTLVKTIQKAIESLKGKKQPIAANSQILFLSTTILYLIISVHIYEPNGKVTSQLTEVNILLILVKFIDHWKWNSSPVLRIRNIISLFSKCLQYLFGDFEKRSEVKSVLQEKYGISKEKDTSKLTTTPLDYHTFRDDITSRYPALIPPPSTLPDNFENSSSLSQFLNISRTLDSHKANSSLPPPSGHISTPAPSPPSTPINKAAKTKRSYQVNQSYPFIYPTEETTNTLSSNIPKSIEEASHLCSSRLQDKLSLKQLWCERDNFMKQERGWTESNQDPNEEFDYYNDIFKNDEDVTALIILERVEKFYGDSLPYLSSLVHVILQVAVSATENNDSFNVEAFKRSNDTEQETIRIKDIALKKSIYSLILLLKWFKVSHILKFEYLSTLVYDSNFLGIMAHYLKSLGDSLYSRITYRSTDSIELSFWKNCGTIQEKDLTAATTPGVDVTFCFNLTSLLSIGSLVCHKKTQRIISLSEKDLAKFFKPFFLLINNSLWKPILKMVKDITPFNGRKWKSHNMDLISMVYLHLKPQLRDNWLSGRDLDGELKDAYGQEIALRAIVQFYHLRRYNERMHELGYKKQSHDFFTREIELIAVSES